MKNMTVDVQSVEIKRQWQDGKYRLVATVWAVTPKAHQDVNINLKLDFNRLPFILPNLRLAWAKEKAWRIEEIERIDTAVKV